MPVSAMAEVTLELAIMRQTTGGVSEEEILLFCQAERSEISREILYGKYPFTNTLLRAGSLAPNDARGMLTAPTPSEPSAS